MDKYLDFRQIIKKRHPNITTPEIDLILPHLHLRKVKKGELILEEGIKSHVAFFVIEGLFRVYSMDDIGQEVTFAFVENDEVFGALDEILGYEKMNTQSIEALEDSVIIWADIRNLRILVEHNVKLRNMLDVELYTLLGKIYYLYRTQINKKPETRYLKFLEEKGNLMNRVTKKHIASYLGVTPESFSRLKSRILAKKTENLS